MLMMAYAISCPRRSECGITFTAFKYN
jgi:hypothetical protein